MAANEEARGRRLERARLEGARSAAQYLRSMRERCSPSDHYIIDHAIQLAEEAQTQGRNEMLALEQLPARFEDGWKEAGLLGHYARHDYSYIGCEVKTWLEAYVKHVLLPPPV